MMKTASGGGFRHGGIRDTSVVSEVNELGENALFTAAEKGHLEVVKELLKYSNKETVTKKNKSGFDPLHIAASQGHHGGRERVFADAGVGHYWDLAVNFSENDL